MLGRYLIGAGAARVADEMSGPAVLLLGLAATGVPGRAAVVFGALTVSAAVGGPLLGALLDRAQRPGRILAVCLLGYATGLAGVAVLITDVPLAVAIAVAAGLVAPAVAGGWTSLLPLVVTPGPRAIALDAATFAAAALAGPAAAAGVATVAGPATAVGVSAAVLGPAALLAVAVPARQARSDVRPIAAGVRDGFAAIVRVGPLRSTTAASCVAFAGTTMVVVACPLLGRDLLGGAGRGTLLLSGLAAASLAALVVLGRRTTTSDAETLFARSSAISCISIGVAAGATVLPAVAGAVLAVVAVLAIGAAEGPQFHALLTVRHREAPEAHRGQVFTTAASLKLSAGALGGIAAGLLAEHSLALLLAVAAATQLLAAVVVRHRATATCASAVTRS